MKRLLLLFLSFCCTLSMTAQLSDYVTGLTSAVGLAQSGNTLFVTTVGVQKIQKIDMTATNPVAVDFVNNISFAAKMVIIGNDMYFTSIGGTVYKADVTLTNPPLVPVISGLASPFGLAVKDNFMYVSLRNDGIIIRFDYTLTNPVAETVITGLGAFLNDIVFYGNDLYMARGESGMISKIDTSQINPVLEDVIAAPGVLEVVVENDFLYYSNNYISRINLLDATPIPESIMSGITATWDLYFDGEDIFLAQQTDNKISKLNTTFVDPTLSPDYDALVSLYNSTDGANWTNSTNWFDTTKSLYSWHGVVTNENNKVIGLNLGGNNLVGTLPTEIGDFDQLKALNTFSNSLSGDLPISFYNLTNLETIMLRGNNLSGTISPSISNLSNLTLLNLTTNDFTGTIPTEFGDLVNLTNLSMADNNFEGTLPSSISNILNLTSIDISTNKFEGTIPFNAPNANIFTENNYYDFSDLEPFIVANNYSFLRYSPQRTPDLPEDLIVPTDQDLTFTVDDANINRDSQNTAMNNEYQWFKDDIAISGANANSYAIINSQESDSGIYHCEITNTIVADLVIVRADITLTVDDNLSTIESEINDFKIHPNPVNNWLTIDLGNQTNANVTLFDVNGKLIQKHDITSNIHVLDVSKLQSGLYLITINSEEKTTTKRFIKQ